MLSHTITADPSTEFTAEPSVPLIDVHAPPIEPFEQRERSGNGVGAKARWAFREFGLFRSARYPPYKLAFQSPFKEALVVSAAAYLAWTAGHEVKRATGKSKVSQFSDMLFLWFRDMVDPPTYYAQELFRAGKLQTASQFLTRYETKNGILSSLNEYYQSPHAVSEMSDKAYFAECCAANRIPHVKTLAIIEKDEVIWNIDPENLRFDIFSKPRKGKGAIGAEAFRYVSPGRFRDLRGGNFTIEHLISHLRERAKGKTILVQRWLTNHESIRDLAHDSLITFRVITCMNEQGDIEVTDAMLRVLVDLEPKWKPAVLDDEFAAPINLATGSLGLLTGDDMRTCCRRYKVHPVTNAKVENRLIEHWPAIAGLASRCHAAFDHRLMIGWDIALTPHGPIMLEGNTKFDVMLLQRVQDRPAGETRLGELLEFHLQKLIPAGSL